MDFWATSHFGKPPWTCHCGCSTNTIPLHWHLIAVYLFIASHCIHVLWIIACAGSTSALCLLPTQPPHISIRHSATGYLPHRAGRKVLKCTWEVVWSVWWGKDPKCYCQSIFIRRGKKNTRCWRKKQKLQVQLFCSFCKGWKMKSDTRQKRKETSSLESIRQFTKQH